MGAFGVMGMSSVGTANVRIGKADCEKHSFPAAHTVMLRCIIASINNEKIFAPMPAPLLVWGDSK